MSKTRQPVKPLNQSPATIAKAAKAEAARKAASKAALHEALDAAKAESVHAEPLSTQAAEVVPSVPAPDHEAEHRANRLATLKVDAEALGVEFTAYLEQEGVNPDGSLKTVKQPYTGPMVALKTARLHYTPARNGVLCNGDPLALLCGSYTREQTVKALIVALKLPGNPYLALNPGQQSMNLRNKARNAIKNGLLTLAEVQAAYEA